MISKSENGSGVPLKPILGLFCVSALSMLMCYAVDGIAFVAYLGFSLFSFGIAVFFMSVKFSWITEEKLKTWGNPDNIKKIGGIIRITLAIVTIVTSFCLLLLAAYFSYLVSISIPELNLNAFLKGIAALSASLATSSVFKLLIEGRKSDPNWKITFKSGVIGSIVCLLALPFA